MCYVFSLILSLFSSVFLTVCLSLPYLSSPSSLCFGTKVFKFKEQPISALLLVLDNTFFYPLQIAAKKSEVSIFG